MKRFAVMVALISSIGLCTFGAPSAAQALDAAAPCGPALDFVAAGQLESAKASAALTHVPSCVQQVAALAQDARNQATVLVGRARDASLSDGEVRDLLAQAQLLDANNPAAKLLTAEVKSPSPATPDLCLDAERAVAGGDFERAQALLDALADDDAAEDCRNRTSEALVLAKQNDLSVQVRNAVAFDTLPLLLLVAVALAIGVMLSSFLRVGQGRTLGKLALQATSAVLAVWLVGLIAWWARWTRALGLDLEPDHARGWLALILAVAAAFGVSSAAAFRSGRPILIQMADDKQADLGALIIGEMQALTSRRSAGIFAPKGTDIAGGGITGALSSVNNPVVKALAAVWNAVMLGGTDRVVVNVARPSAESEPVQASVAMFRGSRGVSYATLDARTLAVTPGAGSVADRDLATAVAASIVRWRVTATSRVGERIGRYWRRRAERREPRPGAAPTPVGSSDPRLYGATSPTSIALGALAERALSGGGDGLKNAMTLYLRATTEDPGNQSAWFGLVSTSLKTYPKDPARVSLLLRQLDEIRQNPHCQGPLAWRATYALAAARMNDALRRLPKMKDPPTPAQQEAATKALELLATFHRPFEAERRANRRYVVESDETLWNEFSETARLAEIGIACIARPDEVTVDDLARVMLVPATTSRSVQFSAICTLALCARFLPERIFDEFTAALSAPEGRSPVVQQVVDSHLLADATLTSGRLIEICEVKVESVKQDEAAWAIRKDDPCLAPLLAHAGASA